VGDRHQPGCFERGIHIARSGDGTQRHAVLADSAGRTRWLH
jgi:hypothetical protein